jgi:hypothetical protein
MKNLKSAKKKYGQKNTSFFSRLLDKSKQYNMLKNNYISDCFIVREF